MLATGVKERGVARARTCLGRAVGCGDFGYRCESGQSSVQDLYGQGGGVWIVHVEYAERRRKYGIIFIFSLFYE